MPRTPEQLARKNAQQRERYRSDPEYRERARARTAAKRREKYQSDPEYRKRLLVENLEYQKRRYQSDPEFRKRRQFMIRYLHHGLSKEQFEALQAEQDSKCAACKAEVTLQIDHDHTCCPETYSCGKCVRGLLCGPCNKALGMVRDDPARLRALADYLERWSE